MSTQEITTEAMALPLSERVSLAQRLWESIDMGLAEVRGDDAVQDALRRDRELSAGKVQGRSHKDVMEAARRALECD